MKSIIDSDDTFLFAQMLHFIKTMYFANHLANYIILTYIMKSRLPSNSSPQPHLLLKKVLIPRHITYSLQTLFSMNRITCNAVIVSITNGLLSSQTLSQDATSL